MKTMEEETSLTLLLSESQNGSLSARDEIVRRIYPDVRKLAQIHLSAEKKGQTLSTTILTNETIMKLFGLDKMSWRNRGHFFAMCSRAMRQYLVDVSRNRLTKKRGEKQYHQEFDEQTFIQNEKARNIMLLGEAMEILNLEQPDLAMVVDLKDWGYNHKEIAKTMDLGQRTIDRYWSEAKTWLAEKITELGN